MKAPYRLLVALAVTVCLASCGRAGSSRTRPLPDQDYDAWQTREFLRTGVRADLPVKGVDADDGSDGRIASVSISLHAIPPPPGVLDDATLLVQILIERITLGKLAERKASCLRTNLYQTSDEQGRRLMLWNLDMHTETSRFDDGKYSYYNRDVKVSEKEILHAHAEVLNVPIPSGMDKDHAAVRRILDSIEPLK